MLHCLSHQTLKPPTSSDFPDVRHGTVPAPRLDKDPQPQSYQPSIAMKETDCFAKMRCARCSCFFRYVPVAAREQHSPTARTPTAFCPMLWDFRTNFRHSPVRQPHSAAMMRYPSSPNKKAKQRCTLHEFQNAVKTPVRHCEGPSQSASPRSLLMRMHRQEEHRLLAKPRFFVRFFCHFDSRTRVIALTGLDI